MRCGHTANSFVLSVRSCGFPQSCGHTANSAVLSVRSCGYPQSSVAVCRKLTRAVCDVVRLSASRVLLRLAANSVVPPIHFDCGWPQISNYLLLRVCRNLSRAVGSRGLPQSYGWPRPVMRVSANSCLLFHAVGRKHLPIFLLACTRN